MLGFPCTIRTLPCYAAVDLHRGSKTNEGWGDRPRMTLGTERIQNNRQRANTALNGEPMPGAPRFGTDGWRGIIAEDFTFAAVRQVSHAVALNLHEQLAQHSADSPVAPSIVIGYDTRFNSARFANAAAEVLTAHNLHVYLTSRAVPAQVISQAIVEREASAGLMITASHNPAAYNGIKVFDQSGAPASSELLHALEEQLVLLQASGEQPPYRSLKHAEDDGDLDQINPLESYFHSVQRHFNLEALRGAGLTVVVDAMFGAGAGILPTLFNEGTTKVIEMNGGANPLFPGIQGPEPVAANLSRLTRVVQESNSSLGIAFDGDADRIGVIGPNGAYINGQTLFALLTLHLLGSRGWSGPIVKSLNGTAMIDLLATQYNVPVFETPVGFTAMAPAFLNQGAIIAGEGTGGFAFRDHLAYRDGIIAALFLLELVQQRGGLDTALAELTARVGTWAFEQIDLPCSTAQAAAVMDNIHAAAPKRLAGVPIERMIEIDGIKYILEDASWLLLRYSGTEPVVRLYAEANSPERVQDLLTRGRELAGL